MAIEWVIAWLQDTVFKNQSETRPAFDPTVFLPLPWSSSHFKEPGELERIGLADAIEGVSGLVVLGDAWGSADVFRTLSRALSIDGHNSVAYAAALREEELLAGGGRSFSPEKPRLGPGLLQHPEPLEAWFTKARATAEANHKKRLAYMGPRLARGEHPDTHSEFWEGYREPKVIEPFLGVVDKPRLLMSYTFLALLGLFLLGSILWFLVRRLKANSIATG